MRKLISFTLAGLLSSTVFAISDNPGFSREAAVSQVSPPVRWFMPDQPGRGLISKVTFPLSGGNVFRFEQLDQDFASNNLEQCLQLEEDEDFSFGAWARTPTPAADLELRLSVQFHANQFDCLETINANEALGSSEQVHDLNITADIWQGFYGPSISAQELADAGPVKFARISVSVRDLAESETGVPGRQVFLDGVWAEGSEKVANGNFDVVFWPQTLAFGENSGPIGWMLPASVGALDEIGFALKPGSMVFRFESLGDDFTDNRLEQCVSVPSGSPQSKTGVWVHTPGPNDELQVRMASSFFASLEDCLAEREAVGETYFTDVAITADLMDGEDWALISAEAIDLDFLSEGPAWVRLSLQARDRSDDGNTLLYLDDVSAGLRNIDATGAWFDPATGGQGFNLQQTPQGLFGYYYGYDDGDPLWLQLGIHRGPIVFGKPFEVPVFKGHGGVFGQPVTPFHPPIWGRMIMQFDSCTDGQAMLIGKSAFQTFELTLLAPVDGADLENCRDIEPTSRPARLSAAWFDPETVGQGWNFLYTPIGIFGYFYGYDSFGAPLWLVSDIQHLTLGEPLVLDLYYGSGGTFEEPVSPGDLEVWGTVELLFEDCTSGTTILSGIDGYQEQELMLLVDSANIPDCQ